MALPLLPLAVGAAGLGSSYMGMRSSDAAAQRASDLSRRAMQYADKYGTPIARTGAQMYPGQALKAQKWQQVKYDPWRERYRFMKRSLRPEFQRSEDNMWRGLASQGLQGSGIARSAAAQEGSRQQNMLYDIQGQERMKDTLLKMQAQQQSFQNALGLLNQLSGGTLGAISAYGGGAGQAAGGAMDLMRASAGGYGDLSGGLGQLAAMLLLRKQAEQAGGGYPP